mgnify:CR=1 FL=1
MEETCVLRPIAHVHSEFPGKFGIPRQSGVVPELRSELIFTPVAWPDFDERALAECLEEYHRRDRRFGGISE